MIPLIRAGAIMPIVIWMRTHGRPVAAGLHEVDLGYALAEGPNQPIPLGRAIAFLCAQSRIEGPDFPCRVVDRSSIQELGLIGEVALRARSVGEALYHVAGALPHHVSRQLISVTAAPGGLILREVSGLRLEDEARHLMQQYVAALMQAVCEHSGAPVPVFERIALVPHPVFGLAHLSTHFGGLVEASGDKALELFVPGCVTERVLRPPGRGGSLRGTARNPPPPLGDGTLQASVRIITAAMLSEGTPTIERLAAAAGLGVRTLQRRLRSEGVSFSDLLDAVRRDLAISGLAEDGKTATEMADSLGYGQPSSLTRAVRRWTGESPTAVTRRSRS